MSFRASYKSPPGCSTLSRTTNSIHTPGRTSPANQERGLTAYLAPSKRRRLLLPAPVLSPPQLQAISPSCAILPRSILTHYNFFTILDHPFFTPRTPRLPAFSMDFKPSAAPGSGVIAPDIAQFVSSLRTPFGLQLRPVCHGDY